MAATRQPHNPADHWEGFSWNQPVNGTSDEIVESPVTTPQGNDDSPDYQVDNRPEKLTNSQENQSLNRTRDSETLERESPVSDSEAVSPRAGEAPPPDATPTFIPKPDVVTTAFLDSLPNGWVANQSRTGYVPPPPKVPKLAVVGGTAIHRFEAMGTPDPVTGEPIYGNWNLDEAAQGALERAGLDPDNPPRSTREKLCAWIDAGIEPETIWRGIEWKMRQIGSQPVSGLGFFDAAVRAEHQIVQRRKGAGG